MLGLTETPTRAFAVWVHKLFSDLHSAFLGGGNHIHSGMTRRTGKNETIQNNVILKINDKGQTLHFCGLLAALLPR